MPFVVVKSIPPLQTTVSLLEPIHGETPAGAFVTAISMAPWASGEQITRSSKAPSKIVSFFILFPPEEKLQIRVRIVSSQTANLQVVFFQSERASLHLLVSDLFGLWTVSGDCGSRAWAGLNGTQD
jgi:hypothetical protein